MVTASVEWLERLMYDRGVLQGKMPVLPVLLSSRPPTPVQSCTLGACGRRNKRENGACWVCVMPTCTLSAIVVYTYTWTSVQRWVRRLSGGSAERYLACILRTYMNRSASFD